MIFFFLRGGPPSHNGTVLWNNTLAIITLERDKSIKKNEVGSMWVKMENTSFLFKPASHSITRFDHLSHIECRILGGGNCWADVSQLIIIKKKKKTSVRVCTTTFLAAKGSGVVTWSGKRTNSSLCQGYPTRSEGWVTSVGGQKPPIRLRRQGPLLKDSGRAREGIGGGGMDLSPSKERKKTNRENTRRAKV